MDTTPSVKPFELIYGIKYYYPPVPPDGAIYNRQAKKQLFQRVTIPDSFNELEFTEDGTPDFSPTQDKFLSREYNRLINGYWFFNNNNKTYITGLHYFYLNYWLLEDGIYPDYRDSDRRWFYFHDAAEKNSNCYGVIRIKKRREGATSQAAAALVYKAITQKRSNCGIISKTGKDASDAFQFMVVNGYRNLPIYLKPRVEDENPKTELIFKKPKAKGKVVRVRGQVYDPDIGMESKINWKNTVINSYDSGRLSLLLLDEGGKFPTEVPINQYWAIVKKTMVKGASKVGFALIPSTVNDAAHGGDAFKKLYEESNHTESTTTGSGLWRYFSPAYDGFVGFIDEYGMSIISTPTDEQWVFMKANGMGDNRIGAKEYLQKVRKNIKDPTALAEEIRMNPFDEAEAFMIDAKRCYFNQEKIYNQLEVIKETPPPIRRGNFIYEKELDSVRWEDSINGLWQVLSMPDSKLQNLKIDGRNPANTHLYCSGIDPFRSSIITGKGSMGVCVISSRMNPLDPKNSGMVVAVYIGRPRLKSLFHNEVLKACIFYGCKATYENDVGDDFVDYFREWHCGGYLSKTPTAALDRNKKQKTITTYGVASRDSFSLARQLETAINYIELHCGNIWYSELLEELLTYDHDNRTSFDLTVAFMISLLEISSYTVREMDKNKPSLLKTYTIRTIE